MRALRFTLIAPLLLGLAACGGTDNAAGQKKPDGGDTFKSLIVGRWLWTEGEYKDATVEVLADGKLRVTIPTEDGDQKKDGTYQLEGDTLRVSLEDSDGEEYVHKINRLDRQELVTETKTDDGKTVSNHFKRQ